MSMYNEIDWRRNDNGKTCTRNSSSVAECAKKFSRGHWSFFALGSEEKWYVTLAHEPDGLLKKGAEEMLIICAESRHPFFQRNERVLCPEDLWKAKVVGNIDTLQRGTYDCRAITTRHCRRESAQYLRSCRGLVPGCCPANQSSFCT